MSYRPICDNWILARAKLKGGKKYYGAYPGGFPERARVLIGCPLDVPMLHVCGGMAREYPYQRGFGINDKTMDLNPECQPDYAMDCRERVWPSGIRIEIPPEIIKPPFSMAEVPWGGILIDPPYSEEDAAKYVVGADKYPNPRQLVATAINTLRVGYRVGILHYRWPRPPANAICVAKIDVTVGYENRSRIFAVYERLPEPEATKTNE